MSGQGNRRFKEDAITHSKEKVAEMRKEEQKFEHKIKAEEKTEIFNHVDKKHK